MHFVSVDTVHEVASLLGKKVRVKTTGRSSKKVAHVETVTKLSQCILYKMISESKASMLVFDSFSYPIKEMFGSTPKEEDWGARSTVIDGLYSRITKITEALKLYTLCTLHGSSSYRDKKPAPHKMRIWGGGTILYHVKLAIGILNPKTDTNLGGHGTYRLFGIRRWSGIKSNKTIWTRLKKDYGFVEVEE
jgi:hypothetical protein